MVDVGRNNVVTDVETSLFYFVANVIPCGIIPWFIPIIPISVFGFDIWYQVLWYVVFVFFRGRDQGLGGQERLGRDNSNLGLAVHIRLVYFTFICTFV